MRKKILLLMLMLMSFATMRMSAQTLGDYTFSTGTDASKWIPLTTTTNVCTTGDAGKSAVMDIGFNFTFGEDVYDKISVNADGVLRFGSVQTGTSGYTTPFSTTNAKINNPKINFLGCDGFMTDSGYVYVELTGMAPNRVLVVEYATSTYNTASRPSLLHYQVQLFEGSNDIQIVYGPNTPYILPNVTRQVGMCIDETDVLLVDATHQMTHYTAGSSAAIALGTWPDVNRYYLFDAPVITCPRPINFYATEVTSTSANMEWTPTGSETQWDLYLSTTGSSPTSTTIPTDQVASPSYLFDNLSPNTTYYVFVRANCGSETSPWRPYTFTTTCVPMTTLPFVENFDVVTGSTTTTTNNLPSCWNYINDGTSSTYAGCPSVYSGSTYAASGTNSLKFYTMTTTGTYDSQFAVLPPIDVDVYPMNTLQVSYSARQNSLSYPFMVVVGVLSNPTDRNTFVPLDTFSVNESELSYVTHTVYLSQYDGSGNCIAIMVPQPTSYMYNYGYIDDIRVEEMATCPTPSQMVASNITSTSMDLSWTEFGEASTWQIEYGNLGFNVGTGTVETVTSLPFTVSNLNPGRTYEFYVKSLCDGGENSDYSDAFSFSTLCEDITSLPLMDDFESYNALTSTTASENNLPNCWHYLSGTYSSYLGYPIIYTSTSTNYAASGVNSLRFYTSTSTSNYGDQFAILPPVDVNIYPINTLQLSMNVRKLSTSYTDFTLFVGVMTDPADASTFVAVDTIAQTSTSYENFTVSFEDYMDTGKYVAFYAPMHTPSGANYNEGYVDDILLEVAATCDRPTNIAFSNITASSVDVNWLPGGSETAWEVAVVPQGDDLNTVNPEYATAHPYTLYNLTDNTNYDVYVRSDCGDGTFSGWSFVQRISTKPLCSSPIDVTISNIAGASALVSWQAADFGAVSYNVEWSEAGLDSWLSNTVTETSYMIPSLEQNTLYDVKVSSNCNSGSADTVYTSFRTGCLAGGAISIDQGTPQTNYTIPVNNLYKYTYSQQLILSSEMNGPTEINGIAFQYHHTAAMTKKTNVNIYLGHTSKSVFSGTNDYVTASNLQLVYSGSLNCQQGWNTFFFTTPFQYNGVDNLVVAVDDNSNQYDSSADLFDTHATGSNRAMAFYNDSNNPDPANPTATSVSSSMYTYMNNMRIMAACDSLATCVAPNIYVSSASTTDLAFAWAPGYAETAWEVEYKADNDTVWSSTISVSTPEYTLNNLVADTKYNIRVRSNCGGEYSNWAVSIGRTECSYITMPYTEDFNDAPGNGSGNMITCWTGLTNSTSTVYPYTSTTYHHNDGYAVYLYGTSGTSATYTYLVSPRFEDNVQMNNIHIGYWAYRTTTNSMVEVGVMTDPNDISTFVKVGEITPSATVSAWEDYEATTASYTGNGRYIAFRIPTLASTTSGIYLDDITFTDIPVCYHVDNIAADDASITASSATVTWTAGSTETAWEYVYGLTGTISDPSALTPMTTTTPSISLTGLNGTSLYEVYVRAICSPTETSDWEMGTFRTACSVISALPVVETFDSYGTGTSAYMACWTRQTTYSSNYPYITTTSYSAPGHLYFYTGSASTYNIAITPQFDVNTIPINTLRATFYYKNNSASDALIVGVLSDPNDVTTFVPVDTVTSVITASWQKVHVDFDSYTGTGSYIGFMNEYTGSSSYARMDNLTINVIPTCIEPVDFNITDVTSTSATFSWTPNGNESQWNLWVVPADSSINGVTPLVANATTYTVSDLTVDTKYDVYIQSVCSASEQSEMLMKSFKTFCNTVSVPYVENFDSYAVSVSSTTAPSAYPNDVMPSCWMFINRSNSTSEYPSAFMTSSTTYAASGNCLFFKSSKDRPLYAVLPPFAEPVNNLQVSFTYRNEGATASNGTLVLGYMTNPYDESSFVAVETFPQVTTLTDEFVSFDTVTATNGYIVFKYVGGTANNYYVSIDNVLVEQIPNCQKPLDVVVTDVTSNSITLDWADNANASSWVIEYDTADFVPGTNAALSDVALSHPYTISNLLPNAPYYFYLKTQCVGSDESVYSNLVTSRTECVALTQLPYVESFDSYPGSTTGTVNNLPYCWEHLAGTYSTYAGYPIIYSGSSYAQSGNNSMRFYTGTTSSYDYGDQYAILPQIDVTTYPINTLQLTMNVRKYSTSYQDFTIVVGVMTDFTDATTFVPVDTITESSDTYSEYTVFFNNYSGTGDRIAIMAPKVSPTGVTYNEGHVDDVVLDQIPNCVKPVDVTAISVMNNSATLGWTQVGSASSWVVEYSTSDFVPGLNDTVVVENVSTNPFTLTNLQPNTTYYAYIKSQCGAGEESEYSALLTFTTICDGITTLPFIENFDLYTGSTSGTVNNLPTCWNNLSGTYSSYVGYPIIYNSATYAQSGSNSLRFYTGTTTSYDYGNQYAILPMVDASVHPLSTLQINMDVRKYSTSYADFTLIVGVMGNATDASTFIPVDTISEASTTYNNYTVYFNNYSGPEGRIALLAPKFTPSNVTYNTGHVDNIIIDVIPNCPPPADLQAVSVTTNSVTLNWVEVASATTWEIEYGQPGFAHGMGTAVQATTHPYTVTGLNPSTQYEFYVRALCSATDTSDWSSSVRVPTDCLPIGVPYAENFDTYTGVAYNDLNGVAPTCWTTYGTSTTYGAPHVVGSGTYYYYTSAPNGFIFTCNTAAPSEYAALPTFTEPLNTLKLNFWRAMENATSGTLKVGYVTSLSDLPGTFVEVETIPSIAHTAGGDTITVDFSTYPDIPATGNIAFYWYMSGTFYSCCIDNVNVTLASNPGPTPCPVPTNLAVSNVTQTSATATWTAGTATAWDFQYKLASSSDWGSIIPLTTATYNLTGLTANTSYKVRVRANCSGTPSDWSSEVTFTTSGDAPVPCVEPSNLTATNATANSVVLDWTENGTATSWTVNYKADNVSTWSTATATEHPYTLTGLTAETGYSVYVVSNCADGQSGASNLAAFTTLSEGSGIEAYEMSTSLYPNPNNGQFTIRNAQFTITGVKVYDAYGKLLKTVEVNGNEATIDATAFANGIYFARIATEKGVVTKSFIKK